MLGEGISLGTRFFVSPSWCAGGWGRSSSWQVLASLKAGGGPGVRSRPPHRRACGIPLSQRLVVWVPRELEVGVWVSGSEKEQRQDKGDGLR